jgi:hypothetical protein
MPSVERVLRTLLERAKLYVESVEVQPSYGDGSRHLESAAARDLRIAIDAALVDKSELRDDYVDDMERISKARRK